MTKVLYVEGDGDYGAMIFSNYGIGVSKAEAYRKAVENGGTFTHEYSDEY